MKVIFINKQKIINLESALLKKIAVYVADKFDSNKNTEVNIIFVDSGEISELNRKYRNVNGPTDVISFSYRESIKPDGFKVPADTDEMIEKYGFNVVGEIIICPEIAASNASIRSAGVYDVDNVKITASKNMDNISGKSRQEWDVSKEIALLIIHGILHLYGYDHENDIDFESMDSLQNTILKDVLLRFFP
ncbi:MAG: rRNA maturation RNase YbeY [Actinobacteria bacterium]|nr:rRNA maturation RNase YbeY [Actinomycetota bacterium]